MSTFSLDQVYRLLGIRSAETLPAIQPGILIPTIQIASIESFAPPSIEARGLLAMENGSIRHAYYMHSTAPGGTVIESYLPAVRGGSSRNTYIGITSVRPWLGGSFLSTSDPTNRNLMSVGGRAFENIVNEIENFTVPFAQLVDPVHGSGVFSSFTGWGVPDPRVFENLYVPPGWFWYWGQLAGGSGNSLDWLRWREIPESQGSP